LKYPPLCFTVGLSGIFGVAEKEERKMEAKSSFLVKRRVLAFAHDLFAIPCAWLLSYWLRFNLAMIPTDTLKHAVALLPLLLVIQISAYVAFNLYRGIWRFASVPDLVRIIKAAISGSLGMMILVGLTFGFSGVPRSVFLLYPILLIAALSGSRLLFRTLRNSFRSFLTAERVLIVGAGQAAEGLIRDILRDHSKQYVPIAVVDDATGKMGREIHGIRVVGRIKEIPNVVERYNIALILIAIPSASSAVMQEIVELCEQTGTLFRTLPSLTDFAAGKVSINALRKVSIEDLLGREPITLDWNAIQECISEKIVLVTGGGGSIGSELSRQVAEINPSRLIIVESSEFNLYSIDMELREHFPELVLSSYLIDITDRVAIANVLEKYKPHVVLHAAAYKHVPLVEGQIRAGVRNNILGTWVLASEAAKAGVEHFTLISTDKAVNPSNIMGASKRAAEIICQNFTANNMKTRFITVRFGNVMASAGSVIPLFRKQIEAGGPVTVTHPDITRFFMTIFEAAQLILQATSLQQEGKIFVLDMGEPIKIKYLAEQMIQLSGLKIGEDISIVYTGLRPGEKLYEELFHANEELISTGHAKTLLASFRPMDWNKLVGIIHEMQIACDENKVDVLYDLLSQLVPEWQRANHCVEEPALLV
jgi:FlaA1/EpsC-like NDP-sugar epimerase